MLSAHNVPARLLHRLATMTLLVVPPLAFAMQPLEDSALSDVAARDGLTFQMESSNPISADAIHWVTDDGGLNNGSCSGGTANQHACTVMNDIEIRGEGGPLQLTTNIDAGSDASGNAYLSLASTWSPIRAEIGSHTFNTGSLNASAQSVGSLAVISAGSLLWSNRGGLFNGANNTAQFDLNTSGDWIYRQGDAGSAELSFANMVFSMGFTNGAAGGQAAALGHVGIDNGGIVIGAPFADVEFTFDLAFKGAPTDFDRIGRDSMIRFGWQGGLVNPLLRVGGGGFGYGTYSVGPNTFQDYDGAQTGVRSQGINLLTEWDFDSDFALIMGEAGGNRTYVRFSDWQRLGNAPGPMFSLPIIFDVMQGGAGSAGLCMGSFASGVASAASCTASGGEYISSDGPAGADAAFAMLIRDGHLRAYNRRVEVIDPAAGGTVTPLDWGLLYTFGKLDADIFLRPQGRADGATVATTDTGLMADITLLIQSPDAWRRASSNSAAVRATAGDDWQTNTHFMAVDTNFQNSGAQYGVGLINSDVMWKTRDMFFRVTDGDSAYPELPGGFWMQSDSLTQYRFRGTFGGGDLSDLSADAITKIFLMDVNLQTNRFLFTLNPLPVNGATGAAPIGFNGLLDFDGNAYVSLAEVSSPDSAFRIHDVGGRLAWSDGSIELISGQNTGDGLPSLAIKNDLKFGESATFGGAPGAALVGSISFGNENFGRIALPAGTWNSEIIVKIPN
ncbi:MAG: hypothetical protein KBT87_12970 [Gammaproteobacteria bacterium]|nr:hypothetical protein [Gammaproteobacteria bacterium]MBQ0775581.1 hypothetical protein [Gammaproteobacteria bacterium]